MKLQGLITMSGAVDAAGNKLSTQAVVDRGWVNPAPKQFRGWGLERHEVPIGYNLALDNSRQYIAYCLGFRSPISSFVISKFGIGTGTTPPKVTDVALENAIQFSPGVTTKAINGIDYPSPFVLRVDFTVGASEGNGYLITELGLYSGDDTLLFRKTQTGISKSSEWAPTLTWRVRC